jgi:MoxR-like ATPase
MTETTANRNWKIFTGTLEPHNNLTRLSEAPGWRPFGRDLQGKPLPLIPPSSEEDADAKLDYDLARTFRVSDDLIEAVNTALYLRRPLLITGKPGNGKSSLIRAVARELKLGPVLRWPITSKSTVKDGLYLYDAMGRLDEHNRKGRHDEDDSNIGKFIELGPLGTALLPTNWPRALLIDEIDKSDLDFPNDLLNIFEDGEYQIPELARANVRDTNKGIPVRTWRNRSQVNINKGHVRCTHFPFVVMTSNREREFAPAFIRRCIRISIEEPNAEMLGDIVQNHFNFDETKKAEVAKLIRQFIDKRSKEDLATDQLLNAIYMVFTTGNQFAEKEKEQLIEKLYKPISGPNAIR